MSIPILHRTILFISVFGLFLFAFLPFSSAECSDRRVKRLLRQGNTVASIARACEMSKEEVQYFLDEEDEYNQPQNVDNYDDRAGLPSGTPVGQCGCWGYVSPDMLQPHPLCRSGYAKPSICGWQCPTGGYAWVGVCLLDQFKIY